MMRKTGTGNKISVGKSQQISVASTVILIVLMLCHLIMTITTSTNLAEQTEIISNHPL